MRTKALLAAVLSVLGISSAFAQVYSVNAVGYINLTLKPGFSMVANQLDNGANNLVKDLMANLPNGSIVYKFNGTSYDINSKVFGNWSDQAMTLAPGAGAFVSVPPGADQTVTLVGEVPQGTLTVAMPQGFSIISSKVPQTVALNDAAYAFPGAAGDIVYRWDATAQNYVVHQFVFGSFQGAPQLAVGDAFFVYKAAAGTWTRTFTVN